MEISAQQPAAVAGGSSRPPQGKAVTTTSIRAYERRATKQAIHCTLRSISSRPNRGVGLLGVEQLAQEPHVYITL